MSADFSGLVGKVFLADFRDRPVLVLAAYVYRGDLFVSCVDVGEQMTPPFQSGPVYTRSAEGLRLKVAPSI